MPPPTSCRRPSSNLIGSGGRAIRRLDRKDDGKPFLTPALIDVTDVAQRPDAELFGPVLQIDPGARFRRRDRRGQCHPLRPRRLA